MEHRGNPQETPPKVACLGSVSETSVSQAARPGCRSGGGICMPNWGPCVYKYFGKRLGPVRGLFPFGFPKLCKKDHPRLECPKLPLATLGASTNRLVSRGSVRLSKCKTSQPSWLHLKWVLVLLVRWATAKAREEASQRLARARGARVSQIVSPAASMSAFPQGTFWGFDGGMFWCLAV